MAYKLGSQRRDTPYKVIRKKMGSGILGEANNDGTIFLSPDIKKGSNQEKEVVAHEGKHMDDMASGKLSYGDDFIKYNGKTFHRKDGKINYNGKWTEEGSKDFPWEKAAYKVGNAAKKQN
jgi:hypothetical protein|tara:strand:+ start:201 stop:560 length:360 start_codon:yes stop_codon:yes gene_type:complete